MSRRRLRTVRGHLGAAVVMVAALALGLAGCGDSVPDGCGECPPTLVARDGDGVAVAQGRTLLRFSAAGEEVGRTSVLPTRRGGDVEAIVVTRDGVAWLGAGPVVIRVYRDGTRTRARHRPAAYVTGMVTDGATAWTSAGRRAMRLASDGSVAGRSPRLPTDAWAMGRGSAGILVTGGPLRTIGRRWRPAGPGWLRVLDPATLRLLTPAATTTPWPRAVADAGGATWIAGDGAVLQRIAPDGGRRTLPAPGVEFLAAGDGALWTLTRDGVLQRRDPTTGRASGPPLDTGGDATSLAMGPGVVWVGRRDRAVVRIDPADPSVTWTRDVPVT